jgi:hypothetical protein
MNKREFVQAGAGALAGIGGWATGSGVSAKPATDLVPTRAATAGSLADWQARIGEQFSVFGRAPGARLVLLQVQVRPGDRHTEQFSLLFGAADTDAASDDATEGVRVLRPAAGDALALHLRPVQADGPALLRADCCLLA